MCCLGRAVPRQASWRRPAACQRQHHSRRAAAWTAPQPWRAVAAPCPRVPAANPHGRSQAVEMGRHRPPRRQSALATSRRDARRRASSLPVGEALAAPRRKPPRESAGARPRRSDGGRRRAPTQSAREARPPATLGGWRWARLAGKRATVAFCRTRRVTRNGGRSGAPMRHGRDGRSDARVSRPHWSPRPPAAVRGAMGGRRPARAAARVMRRPERRLGQRRPLECADQRQRASQPAARGLSNGDRAAALGPWPRPQRPAGPRERVVPDRATATACGARRRTRSGSRSLVVSRERRWRESLTRRRGAHSRARVNQGGPRPPWTPGEASGGRLRRGAARQGACGAREGVCIFCHHPTRGAATLGRAKDRRRCAPLGKNELGMRAQR